MKTDINMPKKHCYKCLLRDMDQNEYFENLYEYVANLDEDIKADSRLYEDRLTCCKTCHYLEEGMCRACGCYVELRAAIHKNRCPYEKW